MAEPHPSSTTIPSDELDPIDPVDPIVPTPQPSSSPPKSNAKSLPPKSLRYHILRALTLGAQRTDILLVRLAKLLSTPSGIDVLLCTTSYTLTLIHAILSRVLAQRLAAVANEIANKAEGVLYPGETLIASLPVSESTKAIAHIVGSSKALAGTIADYRIFVRLWGCVGLYTWARATYAAPLADDASAKDRTVRKLTWAAIASCVGFQVLENGAYLSSKGVLTGASWAGEAGKAKELQWWLWSSRFWAAYVGIELVRLGVERYYRVVPKDVGSDWRAFGDGEKEDKIAQEKKRVELKKSDWVWWKDLASNVAYAPMTIHWSTEQGMLSDWGVGACGMVAGGALLADAWRKTA